MNNNLVVRDGINQNFENRISNVEIGLQQLASFTGESYGKLAEIIGVITTGVVKDMRQQIKEEIIITKGQITQELESDLTIVKEDVEKVKETLKETGIDRHKQKDVQDAIARKTLSVVGGKNTPSYILFYSAVRGRITKLLKDKYKISSYKDISIEEYDEALKYIDSYCVEKWFLNYIIDSWKDKNNNGEIKIAEQRALDIYLGEIN